MNQGALKLMEKTPTEFLCELGVRAFSGSRDVPKDEQRAVDLFYFAKKNAVSRLDHMQAEYFGLVLLKINMEEEARNQGVEWTEERQVNMLHINAKLNELAEDGHRLSMFTQGKTFMQTVMDG
eukprot:CAMPEP_0116870658 /NCGR_PEP_ID=MMETSP0463-20121206/652_1 /TAXON_ID=181622 /ORGANISM="Strombidinopsis sp, Strain SopsisLIS2011" /LENGTH=122 /DNA_ID=CAMNT_0004507587 /DNA_START=245 /DNA_END=613 /DNA_ORIENTATION=+